jgi:levansucrase
VRATRTPRTVEDVNASGAPYQIGNIGLAKAKNAELTEWEVPAADPLGNCVTDQTERPQFVFKDGKSYLFTISHRSYVRRGPRRPEGVYGFVGDGIRSDFQPLNGGSGPGAGNPTNLNFAGGEPFAPDYNQPPGSLPGVLALRDARRLVQSFIDTIGTHDDFVRGGTLAPTVKMDIHGDTTSVDYSYGTGGLGGWADIPANLNVNSGGKLK